MYMHITELIVFWVRWMYPMMGYGARFTKLHYHYPNTQASGSYVRRQADPGYFIDSHMTSHS